MCNEANKLRLYTAIKLCYVVLILRYVLEEYKTIITTNTIANKTIILSEKSR